MTPQTCDVLVIGGGAAGLAAARELSRSGLRTIILEARERFGGRIYTGHNRTSPVPIELGAEFIHGRPRELLEIIEEANLTIEEVTSRHWFFEEGKLIKSSEFWAKVEELMNQMRLDQPDLSFADYLATLPDDDETARAKEIASRYVEGFHAAQLDRIGVHGLIKANEAADDIHGEKTYRIADGYHGVIEWLWKQAEKNAAILRLNARVDQLHWQPNAVEVRIDDELLRATKVIITIPISLLASSKATIRFEPFLPQHVLDAFEKIPMGKVVRLVCEFRRRFWDDLRLNGDGEREDLSGLGFVHYPEAELPTWWTLYPDPSAVLVGWAGGPRALNLPADRDGLLREAIVSLSKIFSCRYEMVHQELREFHYHDWRNDPFTLGGYSFVGVDGIPAQETLAQSVADTIFFAGEATAFGHIGTVHGAIASGIRAARQIIQTRG